MISVYIRLRMIIPFFTYKQIYKHIHRKG